MCSLCSVSLCKSALTDHVMHRVWSFVVCSVSASAESSRHNTLRSGPKCLYWVGGGRPLSFPSSSLKLLGSRISTPTVLDGLVATCWRFCSFTTALARPASAAHRRCVPLI